MSLYRTRTYIAGDFDHDHDAVNQLYEWKNSQRWSLDFSDAHALQTSRDGSKPCSIKQSLSLRMSGSKIFVLIVGNHTSSLTNGSCQFCDSYNSYAHSCARGHYVDYRSYVKYECDQAIRAYNRGELKIIVLYKAATVNKSICPSAVKDVGKHIAMLEYYNGQYYWNYQAVKAVFDWANGLSVKYYE